MSAAQCAATRLLIVEDNVITAQEIRRQLTSLGYRGIECAFSGTEALKRAQQTHPDLILMDIHLGDGPTGIEIAERIWTSLRIPVVYLTAYTDSETLHKAHISEPFGYIIKPFDERTLYAAIETALVKYRAEALVEQQRNLLNEIFVHVQEGLALVDECGAIVLCNPSYAEIVGERLPENLIGTNVFRFFDQDTTSLLIDEMKQRQQGRASTYEVPLTSLHEQRRWVRLSVVPRFDEQQRWIGEFVTMLDLTARQQMEADLLRAQKAAEDARLQAEKAQRLAEQAQRLAESASRTKGEFLAHLSHELRTPLHAILGYAQLLSRQNAPESHAYTAIDTIVRSGEHVLSMIHDVLDFSKIEAGKIELARHPFSVASFLKQVMDIAQVQGYGKNIQFTCQFDPALPDWIMGDETRLRQVLLNVLNNALKFTDRGTVHFSVHRIHDAVELPELSALPTSESATPKLTNSPTHQLTNFETQTLRFEVHDTGSGIAAEMLDRIFLPFSQAHSQPTSLKGTGLGLAICQNLLRLMGSALHVESRLAQGSRFWFDVAMPVVPTLAEEPLSLALTDHLPWGLAWRYVPNSVRHATVGSDSIAPTLTLIPPPQAQLAQLFELARSGDIAGLKAVVPDLSANDPLLLPFADHLHALVKGFHMNDIKSFLGSYLFPSTADEGEMNS